MDFYEVTQSSPVLSRGKKRDRRERTWILYESVPIENFTSVPDSTPLRFRSLKPWCKIFFWQGLAASLPIPKCRLAPLQASCSFSFSPFPFDAARLPMSYILPFCTFHGYSSPLLLLLKNFPAVKRFSIHTPAPTRSHAAARYHLMRLTDIQGLLETSSLNRLRCLRRYLWS